MRGSSSSGHKSMKQSIMIATVCASLVAAQSCQGQPATAPLDANMIKTFQANRTEFEFWRDAFNKPEQNCRVELTLGIVNTTSWPCAVENKERLSKFMKAAGIETIDARKNMGLNKDDGPVLFAMFAVGTVMAGQSKHIEYNPDYDGPLEKDLDVYSWGLLGTSDELPSGHWVRQIEGEWYLVYTAG